MWIAAAGIVITAIAPVWGLPETPAVMVPIVRAEFAVAMDIAPN